MTDGPDTAPPRRRVWFGIKAKLFVAFAGIAGLAVLSGAVGQVVMDRVHHAVVHVGGTAVPKMAEALRIAELGAQIGATAPGLAASRNADEREAVWDTLDERKAELDALIRRSDTDWTPALETSAGALYERLQVLDRAVQNRQKIAAERAVASQELSQAQIRFMDVLEPIVDDAVFDLVIGSETAGANQGVALSERVRMRTRVLNALQTARIELARAAGLVIEAASDSARTAPATRAAFAAHMTALKREMQTIGESGFKDDTLTEAVAAMDALGRGEDSVFTSEGDLHEWAVAARDAHAVAEAALAPMVADTVKALAEDASKAAAEAADAAAGEAETGALILSAVLELRAEGALVAGLLAEGAAAPDKVAMRPIAERQFAAAQRMRRALGEAGTEGATGMAAQIATETLLDFGSETDGIFPLRTAELRALRLEDEALAASRGAALDLARTTSELVTEARAESDVAVAQSEQMVNMGHYVGGILTVLIIVIAVAVMIYYVGRQVVAPIERIANSASRLAAGDTEATLPERGRRDEIGHMAEALGVFRDAAIALQKANQAEILDGRRRLANAIESISEAFSLYDKDDVLVIANSKYGQLLHPGIADEIRPGLTFEEIIRMSVDHGFVQDAEGDAEAWIAERVRKHRNPEGPHTHRRGDGRWILVSERKTDDGGVVAVYSDITDMKTREEELAVKTAALEQLSAKLSKYLSPQIYESIFEGRNEVAVTSRRKKLTVFFSDIAGFTETTDRLESEELTQILNRYLTEMSRIALKYGATIDKYIGDGMMIFFGDPDTRGVKEDALACVRMAVEMQERMRVLGDEWRREGFHDPMKCRMGIHTGFATVGNFGSNDRLDYTIIGGAVNLAARLEGASQAGGITLSYETYALVGDEIECRPLGDISLKGLAYPVTAYEVLQNQSHAKVFEARRPGLTLALDETAMSAADRAESAELLAAALERIRAAER